MLLDARRLGLLTCLAMLCWSGCATLNQNHESPKIDVVGITKAASDTSAMQFTIQLRIVNPNAETIDLHGLYYELSLEGIEVVTGTANYLPPVLGYSATIVSVSSAASLLNSARLLQKIINQPQGMIDYKLRAKLGTSSKWMPSTTIVETGEISLQ
ncbi:MAG: LEA type 2 family protein [Opitutae bacterium]|nr:LEA type 2 family protein [Opitutae bacterium]MDG1300502.1 LEA type 2 family protein [Opitutae bacterium]